VLDLLLVLARWRKTLVIGILASMIVGIGLAFIVKREYKSVARVLPPKETNTLSGLAGLASLAKSLPGNLARFGKNEDPYDFVAILRSRTILEDVIAKFDLIRVYDIPDASIEKAMKALVDNTEVDWTEENVLEIRVWDVDAQRAAAMANYYADLLNKRNFELLTQEARNNRVFIEQRLAQNREDLRMAEDSLQGYQERRGMVVPSDGSASGLSSFAELYAIRVKKEIEVGILRRTLGETHPQYMQAQLELSMISKELSRFPEIGIGSLRLLREVLIQQKIMEMMVPLYEQARINEHKDVPVAYLLDPAKPGERPDRPRRLVIVAIAVFLGIVVSSIVVVLREHVAHLRASSPEEYQKLLALGRIFRFRART